MRRNGVIAGIAAAWLLAAAGSVSSQECGEAQAACQVTDGSYHMMTPATAQPKGIVIHLHGGGGTGRGMLGSGLSKESLARGYVYEP